MAKQHWIRIVVAVVILVVVVILLVPFFINANTFRPTLETQLSSALGRQVTLGNLSFSLLSGSLLADNISVADDPNFSSKPFLQAKSLRIGVETWPIIFHRRLVVTRFIADSPSINLVHAADGAWNFSSLGNSAASRTQNQQQESAFPNLTVGELKIEDGSATVSDLPASGPPQVYSNVNLSVQHFSFAKSFPFQLSAALPGAGTLGITGTGGPVNQKDASDTPLSAKITLKHFDPVAAGVVQPSQGIAMLADVSAQVTSDGQTATTTGTVHAQHLKLLPNGAPTPQPVDLTYTVHQNLAARNGQIESLDLKTGGAAVHTSGSYRIPGQQVTLTLQVSAPNLPIDKLVALLPAVGIRLPSGSSLQGGTLNAQLNVTGPANAVTIAGPVAVNNTRLVGFDLGSKIGGLNPVGGSHGGTEIQTLRANVTSSPAGTQIENLYVSVPAVGTATGNGTVSPAGSLNFKVVAKLNAGANPLTQVASAVAPKGVPINITGTTTKPVIQADVGSMLKQNVGGLLPQQLKQKLGKQANPASSLNKFLPH